MARVVRFHEFGGPEVLRLEEMEVGHPGPGEVLLEVEAIGLNRSEVNFRQDRYLDRAVGLPSGLGYEGAGRIVEVGGGVDRFRVGDAVSVLPVFPQSRFHMYGTEAIVPASALVGRAVDSDPVAAAAAWMPYLTAYGALVDIGRLRAGDVVLVTAPASSVGLAAIQVAVRVGASAIALTDDDGAGARLREAGATEVAGPSRGDLADVVMSCTAGRGADIAFDAVAGPGTQALAEATKQDGILFVHGSLSGAATPLPGLDRMLPVFVRPYTVFEITNDPERFRRAKAFVSSGLATGSLTPVVDRVFDLDDIVEAHRWMDSRGRFGKTVVTVGRDAGAVL